MDEPANSASNARHHYFGGRATPKLKEEQHHEKSHSSSPSIDLGVTKTPKENEKGKNGRKTPEPPLQLATRVEGDEAGDGYQQGKQPKGDPRSESGAEDTVNTHEAEVFEENKAGKGCDEQERQR